MNHTDLTTLANNAMNGTTIDAETALCILTDASIDLLDLIHAAFRVRKHYFGREVAIHILNNAANGMCPEDCNYCAQAKGSEADIDSYGMKKDDEIIAEADKAVAGGAFRYCMVYAGRGPTPSRVAHISNLIKTIKTKHPQLEICVSAGLMDADATKTLKAAGLDRMNHNLNTSASLYGEICSTHTYQDRLDTLTNAQAVGLEVCSGIIVGMGERPQDIIEVAQKLAELDAKSIPVNFFLPIEGTALTERQGSKYLTPEYCLRILCMFRFINPKAEIRAAAGREYHLKDLEALSLYPANSLFLQGYLNTLGNTDAKTLCMIQDAGFTIKSDEPLDEVIARAPKTNAENVDTKADIHLKDLNALRPTKCGTPQNQTMEV
jgi:biotin synthase